MKQTITVFRCGSLDRPNHTPRIQSSFHAFDSQAPEGRILRADAIFASPERAALAPWIEMKNRKKRKAEISVTPVNKTHDQDALVRRLELKLDSSLYVYNADIFGEIHVEAHDNYGRFNPNEVDASPYWESGIPLSEWKNSQFANTPAAESWEVLVSPHHILSVTFEDKNPV